MEDKVCIYQFGSLCTKRQKMQTKHVLFPEYLELTANCSGVHRENTKQREAFRLVDASNKQQKQSFEFQNLKHVFNEINNVKVDREDHF